MQQRKRRRTGIKGFSRQCSITDESLPIEYIITGRLELGRDLANDMNRLSFEQLKMRQMMPGIPDLRVVHYSNVNP